MHTRQTANSPDIWDIRLPEECMLAQVLPGRGKHSCNAWAAKEKKNSSQLFQVSRFLRFFFNVFRANLNGFDGEIKYLWLKG